MAKIEGSRGQGVKGSRGQGKDYIFWLADVNQKKLISMKYSRRKLYTES
jgi:hypothetical protein